MMTRWISIIMLLAAAGTMVASAWARNPETEQALARQTTAPTGRIVVKFTAESGLHADASGFSAADPSRRGRMQSLLARIAPGYAVQRHFTRSNSEIRSHRLRAEKISGRELPDLTRYVRLEPGIPSSNRGALLELLAGLIEDPDIETAFLEPRPVPASLGFDSDGGFTPPADTSSGIEKSTASTTPNFVVLQDYLGPPPEGMNALAAAAYPGGDGDGTRIIDIEGAWFWSHEDLSAPFYSAGGMIDDQDWRNHGTAVLGEIVGKDNSYGVRGVAPGAEAGTISVDFLSTADAIEIASQNIVPGDVILIELHSPGPNSIGVGQIGYMPMEYWQDVFDAVQIATAIGAIVVSAAGNGEENLDAPIYGDTFNREVRDSGSIMVAATGIANNPSDFTNYGSRIDLNGWGNNVATCGYGDLQGLPIFGEFMWYSNIYSGTSSASAMVAGAVLDLQGMFKAERGYPLNAHIARRLLTNTGTPSIGWQEVGTRPDIVAARAAAMDSVGIISGHVFDSVSLALVPGVSVVVRGEGGRATTGASGSYELSAMAGQVILDFSSFYFEPASSTETVIAGEMTTTGILMNRLPAIDIGGSVYGITGNPLLDVRVSINGTAVPASETDSNGVFLFNGIPRGASYDLRFDHLPGYGADIATVNTLGAVGSHYEHTQGLVPVSQDFNLSQGDFGYTSSIWSWSEPAQGPGSAFDENGGYCWGVGMATPYPNQAEGALVSPMYDFSDAEELRLSFHFWSDTEKGFDGANLKISVGGEWVLVEPLTGYTDEYITALGFEPGWSGESDDWTGAVFDLIEFAGDPIKFSVNFASDETNQDVGFWVDAIAWDTGQVITAIRPGDLVPSAPASISAYPNPFNPATTIDWRLPESGPLEMSIFDLRGRLIDVLLNVEDAAAAGSVRWNGTDGNGRSVPSGVYFVRMRGADGVLARRIVTLVK